MTDRSRHPLFGLLVAQFLGAFNDNAFKYIILTLALRPIILETGGEGGEFQMASQTQATIALLTFTIPMMLVSLPAGALADRLSKRSVIVWMKAVEIVLMAAALLAMLIAPTNLIAPLVILGLLGVQAALFSPAKYGILPEVLPHERLSWGNGLIEMWTMLAIIAGTGIGPVLLFADDGGAATQWTFLAAAVLVVLAVAGWAASLAVPRVKPAGGSGGVMTAVTASLKVIAADRVLKLAVIGAVVYWTVISLLGQNIYVYARAITTTMLHGELLSGLPAATFGIGIGVGAVIAGRLSASKVEYGLVPLGAIVLSIAAALLAAIRPELIGMIALMVLTGFGAGVMIVPIQATIQWRSPDDRRGAVIAFTNVLTLGGIVVGSLVATGLSITALPTGGLLFTCAVAVALGTIWAMWLLPDALLRLALVLAAHTFYRIRVVGREHVPITGPALLVPNHVTFVDALWILAATDRRVRFIVDRQYYDKWWAKPFMRSLGAIPISSTGGMRTVLRALREAGEYLDRGDVVCIFAEGQLTRTGAMQPFRRGMERIVKGRTAPIIPVYLGNAWGSIFSYAGGKFVTKWPAQVPYPLTVAFGEPMAPTSSAWEVRQAIDRLGTEVWMERQKRRPPLHRSFIRVVRRSPFRVAFHDERQGAVGGIKALVGAIALARLLRERWKDQHNVGVLLPPSIPGAMVNIAASLAGRASVNLNYTAGPAGMESAIRQAELRTIVTSRAFMEKAKLTPPAPEGVEIIALEDVSPTISAGSRLTALLLALFAPPRLIERSCGAANAVTIDQPVTIIFSSGSTGEPKGVVLTHANLDANVSGIAQVFPLQRSDALLGILPLFHSFGYMTMWLAANHGMPIYFQPNPLDADRIGQTIEQRAITILIATPTFLQIYMRRLQPGSLSSVRLVLTGAEKLPQRVADAFEQTFGIRPVEGYGTTECSPVIATSTLDFRRGGIYQPGSRRGSVGQPLPGVSVRIVDADTQAPLLPGEPGMLLVRGPNVMQGYLNRPDLTGKVLREGWYTTGDIAIVDDEGFVRITDRLSRFSKIGGEMVPHGRVEDALHEAAELTIPTFAVTAVPDEKKGERLAVLHTFDERRVPALVARLGEMGLPNLFIPRADQFIKVDALPMLGTGKLDLKAMKTIAAERLEVAASAS